MYTQYATFVLYLNCFVGMGLIMNLKPCQHTPPSESPDQLISRKALAARWSCCNETVRRREREGKLHPVRFNSKVLRYRLSEILAIEAAAKGEQQ